MDVNDILTAAAVPDGQAVAAPAPVAEIAPAKEVATEAKPESTKETPAADAILDLVPETAPDVEAKKDTAPDPKIAENAERLRKVALQRQREREVSTKAQAAAATAAQENAALKEQVAKLTARAQELAAFEDDPLAWLEKHNRNPVEFLQKAHRIALNAPAVRAEREAKELRERLEAVEKQPQTDAKTAVNEALQARALQDAQRDVVAESVSGNYPLLASYPHTVRIDYATTIATEWTKSGKTSFDYADICTEVENRLEKQAEKVAAALADKKQRQSAQPTETPQAKSTGAPSTITQAAVATNANSTREMTESDREKAMDDIITREILQTG
jgi:hypothetical protein